MNNPQLEPGDVAFKYGKKLANNAVKVLIESKQDENTGKISQAKITITYELDTNWVFSPNTKNDPAYPGLYRVNFDEVGYVGNGDIAKGDLQSSELYITFIDDQAFLNTRIPLKDAKKRENINKRETD